MATKNYLDKTGLTYLWSKIKAALPTKTSDLINDSGFVSTSDTGTVTGSMLANATVGSDKLTTDAVWTANIKDSAVTSAKIDWTTFTPTQGTATINSTYLTGTVYYQKVGRLVKVIFSNVATKTAPPNSSGTTAISGLPQSASDMARELILLKSFTSTGKYLRLGMSAAATTMYFHWSSGTGTATEMDGQFIYFAES